MSWSAPRSVSESIDGITRRRCPQVRLERGAVDHVDWPFEQTRDVLLEPDILIKRPLSSGLKLHQDVEIALRVVVAARDRAEHGRVCHAPRAQGALVAAQDGEGVPSMH